MGLEITALTQSLGGKGNRNTFLLQEHNKSAFKIAFALQQSHIVHTKCSHDTDV